MGLLIMIDYDFIIFASYGNDSISLIQFMKNRYGASKNIAVLFSDAVCCVGIRREESANRRSFPETVEESEKHGGRSLWAPLVRYSEDDRNKLLEQAGFEPLPSRSKECFPCVHANIDDLRQLSEERIIHIENIETSMGINSKGNPRVMFRPKRHQGAVGIRKVVDWANERRRRDQIDMFHCDSGYCE